VGTILLILDQPILNPDASETSMFQLEFLLSDLQNNVSLHSGRPEKSLAFSNNFLLLYLHPYMLCFHPSYGTVIGGDEIIFFNFF